MLACPNFFSLWLQYFGLFDIESSVLEFLVEVWRTRSSLLLVFLWLKGWEEGICSGLSFEMCGEISIHRVCPLGELGGETMTQGPLVGL